MYLIQITSSDDLDTYRAVCMTCSVVGIVVMGLTLCIALILLTLDMGPRVRFATVSTVVMLTTYAYFLFLDVILNGLGACGKCAAELANATYDQASATSS
jgi:hypothetical protein